MASSEPATTGRRRGSGGSSARRAQLLAIGAQMFAEKGFTQTTVRDIADAAGILSGSLYHHFSSKEEMLTEVLHGFMDGLLGRFEEIVAREETPRAALDSLIRESFETMHNEREAVALYQSEQGFLATLDGFEFVGAGSKRIEKIWIGVLEAGTTSGDFRSDLNVQFAYRFIRDAVWASVRWYRPGGRYGHEAVAEQYLTLLHDGLLKH
ncbi:MAG: TetR/AcrR family transcriptional regulator [Nocardioides sp.]|uniref:TetR/AcrR family transcriptional regulator n=1 Tax=Nocardioides sp. TaxID=35761 RepID=UPI0039E32541